jgi:hemoglobin-like flavoprotein
MMTPAQTKLVQDSFRKVVPIAGQAAEMFYSRLFEIAPETRTLFKRDLGGQYDKFIQMLLWVVANLHQVEKILPAVEELGRRHAGYDIEPHHFDRVAEALIWTLDAGLGAEFTPDVREAWIAAYGVLAGTMVEAGGREPGREGFSRRVIEGAGTAFYGAINWRDAFGDIAEELNARSPRRDGKSNFWWR